MSLKYKLFCLSIIGLMLSSQAQTIEKGTIVDAISKERLSGATIYMPNTQFQSISKNDGTFALPTGNVSKKTELVFSYVGYQKAVLSIDSLEMNPIVLLVPNASELNSLVVKSKTKETWKKWGKFFTQYFIGTSDAARHTEIKNPEVLSIRLVKKEEKLIITSKAPLLIENKWLGYSIHYDLDSFIFSFKDNLVSYQGSGYYSPLNGERSLLSQWKTRRLASYMGSKMHFFRSLFVDSAKLASEGFRVYQFHSGANIEKERVNKILLGLQVKAFSLAKKEIVTNQEVLITNKDSARYYRMVLEEPDYTFLDSLPFPLSNKLRASSNNVRSIMLERDTILVVFDPERGYSNLLGKETFQSFVKRKLLKRRKQTADFWFNDSRSKVDYSIMYLGIGKEIDFQQNGREINPDLFVSGAMWNEKIADALPWDYDPEFGCLKNYPREDKLSEYELIEQKFDTVTSIQSHTRLFLHLDKTIYDHEENIWLAAYVLESHFDISTQHTLHVTLTSQDTKKIVLAASFVMINGKAAGSLFLADSLAAGDYTLVGYTNTFSKETSPVMYQQEISIRPYKEAYHIDLVAVNSKISSDSFELRCVVRDANNRPAVGKTVIYTIYGGKKKLRTGDTYVMVDGSLYLPLLPKKLIQERDVRLQVDIKDSKAVFTSTKPFSIPQNRIDFHWYPESGHMVSELPTVLAFEAKNESGIGVKVTGSLLENNVPIAHIASNSFGLGTISFIPDAHKNYTLQWDSVSNHSIMSSLPAINRQGAVLNVKDGLISDSLNLNIYVSHPDSFYLLIHNYKEKYDLLSFYAAAKGNHLMLNAQEWGEGLTTITMFDKAGAPVAERTVFKQPKKDAIVNLTVDSIQYGNRSKVVLRIKATNSMGLPLKGSFSLACVRSDQIDTIRHGNISSSNIYDGYPDNSDRTYVFNYPLSNDAQSQLLLLTKFWTNYKWNELLRTNKVDMDSGSVKGTVLFGGKSLKHKVEVVLINEQVTQAIITNSTGEFEIDPALITTGPDGLVNFFVNEKNKEDYEIKFLNQIDSLQPDSLTLRYPIVTHTANNVQEIWYNDLLNKVKTLSTVRVSGKTENTRLNPFDSFKSLDCRDYVCMNDILNCRNHLSGRSPIDGKSYRYEQSSGNYRQVTYLSCKNSGLRSSAEHHAILFPLKGRQYSKEFYIADYNKFNPVEPETYSTLYWNPEVVVDSNGEATITFNTNDLTGNFLCIIQGLTVAGPAYGKCSFVVSKKNE